MTNYPTGRGGKFNVLFLFERQVGRVGACYLDMCCSGGRKSGWMPQWFFPDLPDAAHRSGNKKQVWAPLVDVCNHGHKCDEGGSGCTECSINRDATVTVWGETLAMEVEDKLLEEDSVLCLEGKTCFPLASVVHGRCSWSSAGLWICDGCVVS